MCGKSDVESLGFRPATAYEASIVELKAGARVDRIDREHREVVLADGTPLTVHRFDDHWISAIRGDMSYELDRHNGNLTYASSTTKDGAATITIGSGRCEIAPGPAR